MLQSGRRAVMPEMKIITLFACTATACEKCAPGSTSLLDLICCFAMGRWGTLDRRGGFR